MSIDRRYFLQALASALLATGLPLSAHRAAAQSPIPFSRVRPGEAGWPSQDAWELLGRQVGGRLTKLESPLDRCAQDPADNTCAETFAQLRNPYYLGDDPALTQTLGWVDAWTSRPSVFAVKVRTTDDVAAAVNFARENRLRLVVKGGGHSYQGRSSAPDSMLIWTRAMDEIEVRETFVPAGCAGSLEPQSAVTVGAGTIWTPVYDAVTTEAGRYVQGGGCLTVGVAGLIQSGGFGSFSKAYGLAAASLLEAEIVTADGTVRVANACTNPDLFWGIKGGGGGSLGVVTRLTLRTHELPDYFGGAFATVRAASDGAFHQLIARFVEFYSDALFSPHWGEQVAFRPDNTLSIAMVFQGLDQHRAEELWRPFLDWLAAAPEDFSLTSGPTIMAVPARRFWDPELLSQVGGLILTDERPDAPPGNIFWAGNKGEAGQVLHGYKSTWLSAALLTDGSQPDLVRALFAASRQWGVALHFNKGLAGAPESVIEAARDCATNPVLLDAFALAISGAEGPPAYPGIPGHESDRRSAHRQARAIDRAMAEVRKLVTTVGSYVSESDYFEVNWQRAFWGTNYPRLREVKDRNDPDGLFFVHHGVGSENWSPDGFTKLS